MNVLICLEPARPSRASRSALRVASGVGEGARIIVLTAGSREGSESLDLARRCNAIDRVVNLQAPTLDQADAVTLGMVLSEAARHLDAGLIITGETSDDEGQGLVPAALAHHLRAPLLSRVQGIRAFAKDPAAAEVNLQAGGRLCRLRCSLPIVASVPPLWPHMQIAADRAPCGLETLTLEQLGIDQSRLVFRPDLLGTLVPGRAAPMQRKSYDEASEILLRRNR